MKTAGSLAEGFAAGADHYITKPFQFLDVLARLAPPPP